MQPGQLLHSCSGRGPDCWPAHMSVQSSWVGWLQARCCLKRVECLCTGVMAVRHTYVCVGYVLQINAACSWPQELCSLAP